MKLSSQKIKAAAVVIIVILIGLIFVIQNKTGMPASMRHLAALDTKDVFGCGGIESRYYYNLMLQYYDRGTKALEIKDGKTDYLDAYESFSAVLQWAEKLGMEDYGEARKLLAEAAKQLTPADIRQIEKKQQEAEKCVKDGNCKKGFSCIAT